MNPPPTPAPRGQLKLLTLWALVVTLAVLAVPQSWALMNFQPAAIDFLPLWTAGKMAWTAPGKVYDFTAVTNAQYWLLPHLRWPRPFAYPPTALIFLAPFGALPFWPAVGLWLALSLGLFLYAGMRLVREHRLLALALMIVSPAVILAVLVGQTVLLAAGLAILAVVELEKRPRLAGVLLAIAAAIKPQVVLLAPVALLAAGASEALVSAALAFAALAAMSVVLFGAARWSEWLGTFAPFQGVIEEIPRMMWGVITPFGLAWELGLSGIAATALRIVFGLTGLAIVWRVFSRSREPALRLAALLGAGLLAAPYAMHYDATLLVPAAAAIATQQLAAPGWIWRLLALVAVSEVTTPHIGAISVIAFVALTCGALLLPARPTAAPAPATI
ncbi:MAG: glycosyltransferase family 87 protein [Caulobacterales bacterium]